MATGRTLHIVKSAGSPHPWDLIAQQPSTDGSCTVVLIQDAVAARPTVACTTFVLERDASTRGASTPYPRISDDRLVELIWEAETVIVW